MSYHAQPIISSNTASLLFSLFSPWEIPNTCIRSFEHVPCIFHTQFCFSFYYSFLLCDSRWIISIDWSLSSLILPPAVYSLLLNISSEFLISNMFCSPKCQFFGWLQRLTPVIPALWEAEADGSLELKSWRPVLPTWWSPVSTKNTKISWPWGCAPVVPATQEA